MPRPWLWLQLLLGWIPIWALYATMIVTVHDVSLLRAALIGGRAVAVAALLGLVVHRLAVRLPWPHPMRLSFGALHLLAAAGYSVSWLVLVAVVEHVIKGHGMPLVANWSIAPFLILGIWFYVMVAGVSYANAATIRAAAAEAAAARSQLAALRSQLNPHFLFNALHSVVQLIPRDPARAAGAAEEVAGLLRTTIEEDRDLVTLGDELAFVDRYLALERLRFGDRLVTRTNVPDDARDVLMPCFALQALVENAVRHGAGPNELPTTIDISARREHGTLVLAVVDDGAGSTGTPGGTGLTRLRARLAALYGTRATLAIDSVPRGFSIRLTIPEQP